jgi:hypothetical protein
VRLFGRYLLCSRPGLRSLRRGLQLGSWVDIVHSVSSGKPPLTFDVVLGTRLKVAEHIFGKRRSLYSMPRWLDLGARLLIMRCLSRRDLLATQHKDLCYVSGWIDFLLGVIGMSTMPTW